MVGIGISQYKPLGLRGWDIVLVGIAGWKNSIGDPLLMLHCSPASLQFSSLEFSFYSLSSLQVVIPDSNTGEEVVVASLTEGNYFGEISLLRLDAGKNRLMKSDHF